MNLEPTARVYRPRKPPLIVSSDRGGGGGGGGAACNYQGPAQVRHCSFFGDPHLVTFNGQFQTCKVNGAWPLIDNAYLAVSVTNEAVVPGSPATATTKVSSDANSLFKSPNGMPMRFFFVVLFCTWSEVEWLL